MKSSDIRRKYLDFFTSKGHAVVPAAPIVPTDDPTTLFTSSGMQQMVPYLKGAKHPMGTRICDSQPSFRSDDIEEVGDNRHTCMFEMLGNWSLGDYFKKEQLPWIFEFFTKEIGLDPARLYVSVFAGDDSVARDDESISIWQNIFGITTPATDGVAGFNPSTKIYLYPAKKNWWSRAGEPSKMPVGEIGGPDSEIFYDFGADLKLHENSPWKDEPCHINCDCGRFLEIGNSVFMQFVKTEQGMKPLPAQNVDFGGGLERIVAASQNTPDIFETDMFSSMVATIELSSGKKYEGEYKAPMRVIADHLRAAVFMIAQGTLPSNKLQGYILRRLLRRAAVRGRTLGGDIKAIFTATIPELVTFYSEGGFIDSTITDQVTKIVLEELTRFDKALNNGLKEMFKVKFLDEQFAFKSLASNGLPYEITKDLARERGVIFDDNKFLALVAKHKEASRTASAGMFKGGLADHSETTTKYHTATHLIHQALHDVLGDEISQAGSNITVERLRFDYTYNGKPTPEQIKAIEQIVNTKIKADLPVVKTIEDKESAIKSGARAFFAEKYPEKVSVYTIGDYSRELCGGPHVERTGTIGKIEIFKDESLGSGRRRLYARLA